MLGFILLGLVLFLFFDDPVILPYYEDWWACVDERLGLEWVMAVSRGSVIYVICMHLLLGY